MSGLILFFRRGTLNKLTLAAASLLAVAAECLAIEWFCILALGREMKFGWSLFVLAPCVLVAMALFVINGNGSLREEVRRRAHF